MLFVFLRLLKRRHLLMIKSQFGKIIIEIQLANDQNKKGKLKVKKYFFNKMSYTILFFPPAVILRRISSGGYPPAVIRLSLHCTLF